MFSIVGIIILFVMVFGGFAITGGALGPVMEAIPHELLIILGAAAGATVTGNSMFELKGIGGGFAKVFKGPKHHKQDHIDAIANAQTVVGSRLAFVDLTNQHRQTVGDLRKTEQGDLGGTDIASTIVQLQQTLLVLQASQDSFAKLASLNLFDKIN